MNKLIRLRELTEKYRRWHSLEKFINRIELNHQSDLDSAIASAHSLIESILKTILFEREKEYQDDPSKLKKIKINPLATKTLRSMNLVRHEPNSKVISGMVTAIQNLGEIRNSLAHGKNLQSLDVDRTEEIAAYFLINSIESIACFLIEFYEVEYPLKAESVPIQYEDYEEFNDWLDDEHGTVSAAGIPVLTSGALFSDAIAYKSKYQEYLSVIGDEVD